MSLINSLFLVKGIIEVTDHIEKIEETTMKDPKYQKKVHGGDSGGGSRSLGGFKHPGSLGKEL